MVDFKKALEKKRRRQSLRDTRLKICNQAGNHVIAVSQTGGIIFKNELQPIKVKIAIEFSFCPYCGADIT